MYHNITLCIRYFILIMMLSKLGYITNYITVLRYILSTFISNTRYSCVKFGDFHAKRKHYLSSSSSSTPVSLKHDLINHLQIKSILHFCGSIFDALWIYCFNLTNLHPLRIVVALLLPPLYFVFCSLSITNLPSQYSI